MTKTIPIDVKKVSKQVLERFTNQQAIKNKGSFLIEIDNTQLFVCYQFISGDREIGLTYQFQIHDPVNPINNKSFNLLIK